MPGLGKQVERLDRGEGIAGGQKILQVAHLGGRVARDVHDCARAERKELREEGGVAALARGIDDDGGVRGGEREAAEDGGRVAGLERRVGDVVCGGAFCRAKVMLLSLISMPATRSKAGAAVRAKSPLPQ